jgi:hypothetical protein
LALCRYIQIKLLHRSSSIMAEVGQLDHVWARPELCLPGFSG